MSDTCVNLRERFGHRYRIAFDRAYRARHVPRDKLDPWAMLIPCRCGEIWPHGGTVLAVEIEGRRPITVKRLLESGACALYRDGDDGATLLFDVSDFETVAAVVRPRRRRHVSEAERARLRALSAQHGFRTHPPDQANGVKPGLSRAGTAKYRPEGRTSSRCLNPAITDALPEPPRCSARVT